MATMMQQYNYSWLKQPLAPLYLISTAVTLLGQEAIDAIRHTAHAQGFQQRDRYQVVPGFNWAAFFASLENLSLFSNKTVIELHHPKASFDNKVTPQLLSYLNQPIKNNILIISTDKLSASQQKTRWYQAIQQRGVIVPIPNITPNLLPRWIKERAQTLKLSLIPESVSLLAELTQGNLLATQQALEKLTLLYEAHTSITPKEIHSIMNDNAQFTVFELSNFILSGHANNALRIVKRLLMQQTEPTLILWAICREIRELAKLIHQQQQGIALTQLLQKQWASRRTLLETAVKRLTISQLNRLSILASTADRIIKGLENGNIHNIFEVMVLEFCGKYSANQRRL